MYTKCVALKTKAFFGNMYYFILILDRLRAFQNQQQMFYTGRKQQWTKPNRRYPAKGISCCQEKAPSLFRNEMLSANQFFYEICSFPLHHFFNFEMGSCSPTAVPGGLSPSKDLEKVQWRIPLSLESHFFTFVSQSLVVFWDKWFSPLKSFGEGSLNFSLYLSLRFLNLLSTCFSEFLPTFLYIFPTQTFFGVFPHVLRIHPLVSCGFWGNWPLVLKNVLRRVLTSNYFLHLSP